MFILLKMTKKRKHCLWIGPSLNNNRITLTGGTFNNYGIPGVIYKNLCTREHIYGNMYQFDPESRSKAVAHVEDRGRHTKRSVLIHSPTFSIKEDKGIGCFMITQYIYTFDSDGYAKEVFKNVLKAYDKQLNAYESMMTMYRSEKKKRFDKKIIRKQARKAKVDSDPEKVSKREAILLELQKKASN